MKTTFPFILMLLLFSCKKDNIKKSEPLPEPNIPAADSSGQLKISIKNVVGANNLVLGNTQYVNANNDTFSIGVYKYYLSNVELKTATNTIYKEPESYFLIDQSKSGSLNLFIKKVPKDNYSSISFYIGVDSARNVSGIQSGALDPIFNMFWDWNQGYIMARLEGSSPQSSDPLKKILYHIGGYSGINSGVRKVTLSFPNTANVTPAHTPTLNLNADVEKWFTGSNPILFSVSPTVGDVGADSKTIADNYATMFSVTSVVN